MCRVLHENCNRSLANDRELPNNSFLVTYLINDKFSYDIVICNKRVDVFDFYWDKYREDLKKIEWTEGRVNPKLWDYKPSGKSSKK
jgi:hypothetical protein